MKKILIVIAAVALLHTVAYSQSDEVSGEFRG